MKCPNCSHVNDWSQDRCQNCERDVAYVRERMFIGRQFAFFEASEAEPILVDLTPAGSAEAKEQRLVGPTIVSRHQHGISFGEVVPGEAPEPGGGWFPWPLGRRRRREPRPSVQISQQLPALELQPHTVGY